MDFPKITTPEKINPCPINQAIIELRFETDLPSDAVFGLVYNNLKGTYDRLEKLPILQIPEMLREKDPSLIYQPHYKLLKENFILQIGPRTISLISTDEYMGWKLFSQEFINKISILNELKIIKNINRVGIRYINFFENENILKNIKLKINYLDKAIESDQTYTRFEFFKNDFKIILQISNHAELNKTEGSSINGSTIDIDLHIEEERNKDIKNNLETFLNQAHEEEKQVFFNLLNNEVLAKLLIKEKQ